MNQPRDDDGRFGSLHRDDPGQILSLWSEDEGSFEFPPKPTSPQHLMRFWRDVDIPEATVATFADAANERRNAVWQNAHREFRRRYPQPQREQFRRQSSFDDAMAQWRQAEEAMRAQALRVLPRTLDRYTTRAVIRAACVYREAANLPGAECEMVRSQKLQLRPGGPVMTFRDVWMDYQLEHLEKYLVNPDSRASAKLADMLRVNEVTAHNVAHQTQLADENAFFDDLGI